MKTIKLLLCVLVLTALSCEKEESDLDSNSAEFELEAAFKSLTNSKIGFEKDGQLVLAVSNDLIIKEFKNFVTKSGLELKPQSFEVISVDNNEYLRFYSEGGEVSTLALLKDRNNQYRSGTTVCTTTNCASGGGCLPNGSYCSKCTPPPGYPNDCVRTSTGGNQ